MVVYALWCALVLSLCSLECFRVLQNGNYMPQRGYFKVVKSWYFTCLCCLAVFSAMWQVYFPYPVVLCGAYTLCAIPLLFVKRKVQLRFTKRIIRMIIAEFALLAVACCFSLWGWTMLLPVFVLASWLICLPLDVLINRRYLASAHKKLLASNVTVIAITGSFGKTSTKNMLATLLNDSIAPKGSCNTPLGIAKYINNTDLSSARFLILEFGARKRGDIQKLCNLFVPKHGILTGVCPQHLQTFGSFENIVQEKGSLVEYLPEDGCCILAHESVKRYFECGTCAKTASLISLENVVVGLHGLHFTAVCGDCRAEVRLPHVSSYSAEIFATCATLCLKLGQSFDETVANSKFVKQCRHRLEVMHNGTFYIIDDSYNACTAGVDACFDVLSKLQCKKIVVLQGIVECGKDLKQTNFGVGQKLGSACDVFIACGKNRNALCSGAITSNCTVVKKVKHLKNATELFKNYVCKDCVLLFQNDLPDVVNV